MTTELLLDVVLIGALAGVLVLLYGLGWTRGFATGSKLKEEELVSKFSDYLGAPVSTDKAPAPEDVV